MVTSRCLHVSSPVLSRWWHGFVVMTLGLVCALLYLRTLDFPMQYDDNIFVRGNALVMQSQTLDRYFHAREFVASSRAQGLEEQVILQHLLRPVVYATFHWNYLFDGFHPRWYRAFNVAIHAANAVLLYGLLISLFRQTKHDVTQARLMAAASALLFVVHPLATESVTFIFQRCTSLAAFFYLLVLGLHFQPNATRWHRVEAVAALLLGMLTKECTVTAPIVAVLLDVIVLDRPWRVAVKRAVPLLCCLPVVPLLVLFAGWAMQASSLGQVASIAMSGNDGALDSWSYLVTQSTVLTGYLARIVWPQGLNIDPEWPLIRTIADMRVVASLTLMLAIVATAWWFYRRRGTSVSAWALAFTLWFFISIFPSSGLVPLPDLMADHRTYLPGIGILVIVVSLCFQIKRLPLVLPVVAVAFSVCTWQRNDDWRSVVSLWQDTVAKSPGKCRPWSNLGTAYGEQRQFEEALRCYRRARELEPRYETAYVNAAIILNEQNRFREALVECKALLQHVPEAAHHVEVLHNMGVAAIGVGDFRSGMKMLNEVAASYPDYRPTQLMLQRIHARLGSLSAQVRTK